MSLARGNLADPQAVNNWFQLDNRGHLLAYKVLTETGSWPRPFWDLMVDEGVSFPTNWQVALASRMADKFLELKLKETKL